MYSQHRQIIALLGFAHKLVDSFFHFANENVWMVAVFSEQLLCQTYHTRKSELGMIEVFGLVAEEERNMIRARQAEGIAAWRRTGQTKTGRPYGRPRKEVSAQAWDNVRSLVKEKRINTAQAWQLLGVSKNTYYRLIRRRTQENDV